MINLETYITALESGDSDTIGIILDEADEVLVESIMEYHFIINLSEVGLEDDFKVFIDSLPFLDTVRNMS